MITYLAVLAFLLLFMFFIEREKKGFFDLSFRKKYRKIIILGTLGLVPIMFVQLVIPEKPRDKGAFYERLSNGENETNRLNVKIAGLKYRCREDPSYKNFVELFQANDNAYLHNCEDLRVFVEAQNLSEDKTSILFGIIKTVCQNKAHDTTNLVVKSINQPGYNYSKALNLYYLGAYDSAEVYFTKELSYSDLKESSYLYLEQIVSNQPKKLKALYLNWDAIKYLPEMPKQKYYFDNGYFAHYTYSIYNDFYRNAEWLTILIAFLVCSVWVFYLRTMDIFERESWFKVFLVFALSWAATNLCFYSYDFFHYKLNWFLHTNDNAFEDFMYCTIVIGGSEELIKLIPWTIFLLFNRKAADEPYDYLLFACVSALGFAGAENVMYYERHDMMIISQRAIMSSVGHMFDASLIAYSVILMKYRFQNKPWRYWLPVLGFLAAILAHGFYDYWIITPPFPGSRIMTLIFFILSIHVWKNFKNNALNHSTFYSYQKRITRDSISFILLTGFILILMIEYVVTSYQLGHENSSMILRNSSLFMAFLGVYLITTFEDFKLRKGRWEAVKWPFENRVRALLNLPSRDDLTGLRLRLFSPKDNPYVGQRFPITGHLSKELFIDEKGGWFLFEIDQSVDVPGFESKYVILRSKNSRTTLEDERIENILLLIPLAFNVNLPDMKTTDFRYVGRTYSSPIW